MGPKGTYVFSMLPGYLLRVGLALWFSFGGALVVYVSVSGTLRLAPFSVVTVAKALVFYEPRVFFSRLGSSVNVSVGLALLFSRVSEASRCSFLSVFLTGAVFFPFFTTGFVYSGVGSGLAG